MRSTPLRTFLIVPLLALASSRCGRSRQSSPEPSASIAPPSDADRAAAEDAARKYFGALQAKDCASLPTLVKGALSAEECLRDVNAFVEHRSSLVRVVGAKVDGRDPNAILVTVVLRFGDSEREEVFRIERDGAQWKVRK